MAVFDKKDGKFDRFFQSVGRSLDFLKTEKQL